MQLTKIFSYIMLLLFAGQSFAKVPEVGRKAAEKYFKEDATRNVASASSENLLMLHLGSYVNSQAYAWQSSARQDGVGKSSYGVTYLFDQWGSLDTNLRLDFNEYKLTDHRPIKLSLLPLWTFPRAESHFPLYFGFGAGVGVFFTQVPDESNLSIDYQLVAGARFMDLSPGFGAFIEFGLKNHLHLLSDGQLNGTVVTGGAVFTF